MEREYNDFKAQIKERLAEAFPEAEITTCETAKGEGISIKMPGNALAPTLYPRSAFDDSMGRGASMEETISAIVENAKAAFERVESVSEDEITDFTMDYEKIKKHLSIDLRSRTLTSQIDTFASVPFMGEYVICFRVDVSDLLGGENKASFMVRKSHLEMWGVDIDTLKEDAFNNTANAQPAALPVSLESVVSGLLPDDMDMGKALPPSFSIATNETRSYGASVILYPGYARKFEEENGPFYVIPSSIHETLLIPENISKDMGTTPHDLARMARDVNASSVATHEQLGNTILYYRKGKFSVAAA